MKKQNKTSSTPLNWWSGGPENYIIGYYSGTTIVQPGDVLTLNKTDWQVRDITYSFNTGWNPMVWFTVGSDKKTLNVTKKEVIKFV